LALPRSLHQNFYTGRYKVTKTSARLVGMYFHHLQDFRTPGVQSLVTSAHSLRMVRVTACQPLTPLPNLVCLLSIEPSILYEIVSDNLTRTSSRTERVKHTLRICACRYPNLGSALRNYIRQHIVHFRARCTRPICSSVE
jgi:hypothetical protein